MEKLKSLVFSFYREEPLVVEALYPLHGCHLSRKKGAIIIECINVQHFSSVKELLPYISQPFLLLGVGKKILIHVPGVVQTCIPMNIEDMHTGLCN